MKIFRYIRPTSRKPVAHQMRVTERDDIHFTVVEGQDGYTFDATLLKVLKRGNCVLVEDLNTFGRRRATVCDRLGAIFALGASVVDANGTVYTPECGDAVVAAFMEGQKSETVRERIPHNKASAEDKERALNFWLQTDLTNEQVERLAGFTYSAMHSWFAEMYPRNQPRGRRPRKGK